MQLANFKIGRTEYVVIPKRDYERLLGRKKKLQNLEDLADLRIAKRKLNDPADVEIPCELARKRLGLA
jgi:hypothetical protein